MPNTTNYNLLKQDENWKVSIEDINNNMDIIDEAIRVAYDSATTKYTKPVEGIPHTDFTPLVLDVFSSVIPLKEEFYQYLNDDENWSNTDYIPFKERVTQHLDENATTTTKGHVQLNSSVTSTSETLAATPKAVKTAMDRADAAFTQANDMKTKWASVVGSPLLSTDTQAQLQTKTQTIKNALATNLTAKGQTSVGTETMTALVNKVPNINTGKPELNGTVNGLAGYENRTVTGLSFKPSMVELFVYSTDGLLNYWGVLSTGASPLQDVYYDRSYITNAKQLSLHLSITNDGFILNGAIAGGRPYNFVWRARG